VTSEQDLLRDLQAVLASAEVDVTDLVEGAWADAQEEVGATLRRLMIRDLLRRSVVMLGGDGSTIDPALATPSRQPVASQTDAPATSPRPPAGTADPEARAAPAGSEAERRATYLFGIVGPDAALPRTDLPRLPGGGPVRLLDVGGGRALVCDVDPETFVALQRPGPDGLDLLAEAARTHDVVLARFVDAPVLPMPLGAVLPDDDHVIAVLLPHADRLRDELARLTGFTEWAVTVRTIEDAAPDVDETRPTSGRAYLEAQREALNRRDDRWADQERLIAELHGPLAACAADAEQVASRPLEDATPPLLHGVYLVADDARQRFESTVSYLRTEHPRAVIEVTGPWPPYHFTALELSVEDEHAS
jgi:hypothetical protein